MSTYEDHVVRAQCGVVVDVTKRKKFLQKWATTVSICHSASSQKRRLICSPSFSSSSEELSTGTLSERRISNQRTSHSSTLSPGQQSTETSW